MKHTCSKLFYDFGSPVLYCTSFVDVVAKIVSMGHIMFPHSYVSPQLRFHIAFFRFNWFLFLHRALLRSVRTRFYKHSFKGLLLTQQNMVNTLCTLSLVIEAFLLPYVPPGMMGRMYTK